MEAVITFHIYKYKISWVTRSTWNSFAQYLKNNRDI